MIDLIAHGPVARGPKRGPAVIQHSNTDDDGEADGAGEYAPSMVDAAVYHQLKNAARILLQSRRNDQSLTPTSLVHDAYLRLTATERAGWRSEAHFRAAAATSMRHILVDRARRRAADKHGGGWARVTLTGLGDGAMDVGVVALSEALDSLAELDPRGAEIVQMRFLAGMTNEQISEVLEVSIRTVERDWRAARAWLLDALAG